MSTRANLKGTIPLRERRTLADEYRDAAKLLPPNAPEVQRVETRRAFYVGASSMFTLMTGGLDPEHDPTDLDVEYIESLALELTAFAKDLAEGRA